jgi:hypothetical protein
MDDRAKAVQGLPCQWNGSDSAVSDRPAVSPADAEASAENTPQKRQNPGGDQGSDADCRSLSSDDSGDCQWRRRELNPQSADNAIKESCRFSEENNLNTLIA